MKSKLYVLSGHSYSGKTTLAKLIAKKKGFEILAFDWLWDELKPSTIPEMNNQEEWEEVYVEALKRIRQYLVDGKSVVFDDISNKRWKQLSRLADQLQAKFKILYLDVPLEEIKRRRDENLITKQRHHVNDENFKKGIESHQRPEGDEVIVYKMGESIESFLEKI